MPNIVDISSENLVHVSHQHNICKFMIFFSLHSSCWSKTERELEGRMRGRKHTRWEKVKERFSLCFTSCVSFLVRALPTCALYFILNFIFLMTYLLSNVLKGKFGVPTICCGHFLEKRCAVVLKKDGCKRNMQIVWKYLVLSQLGKEE